MPEREYNQPPVPSDVEFTDREKLYSRVSHTRLIVIVSDEQTHIHGLNLSTNNYGEFLFVTTSRPKEDGRHYTTFWGMGLHEYRDRWFVDEWHWYEASSAFVEKVSKGTLSKDEALKLIEERRQEILPYAEARRQSKRGELFELVADLTDDDGAWAELQDLENFLDDFEDE